jgi:hypothetical protein
MPASPFGYSLTLIVVVLLVAVALLVALALVVALGALSVALLVVALQATAGSAANTDLYAIGVDGRGKAQLTSTPDSDIAPAWVSR